jgi:hypothetical protein
MGDNPYGVQAAISKNNSVMAATMASREMEQVKGQIMMARMFPRDMVLARSRIMEECKRPEFAEDAEYTYPRGGEQVTGPSINLARMMARNIGNMETQWRELESAEGSSKIEAFCWDMETNFRNSIVFDVPHVRWTRQGGNKPLDDPRDIYEIKANNAARRQRMCILNVIPGDLVDEAVQACRDTVKAALNKSDASMLLKKARAAVDKFVKYGVTKDMLVEKCGGRQPEQWTVEDITELTKIGTSLADGIAKPTDYFSGAAESQIISAAQVEEINRIIGKASDKQRCLKALNESGYTQVTKVTVADFEKVKKAVTEAANG